MDHKLPSNVSIAKSNEILCTFIGFVQRKSLDKLEKCSHKDCIRLLNWFSSKQINFDKKDWYQTEDGNVNPQILTKMHVKPHRKWIYELRSMLRILLKSNGDIKFVDEDGKTILHVFLENYLKTHDSVEDLSRLRIVQMVEYLIDKGIPIKAADINGNTPLHVAANFCNEREDSFLYMWYDKDYISKFSTVQWAQSMLAKGADINLQNNAGWTPVHLAVKHNNLEMLEVFLNGKANLQLLTEDGENAIQISCKYVPYEWKDYVAIELIKLLINGGCDVNVTDKHGYSPLHYACKNYSKKTSDSSYRSNDDHAEFISRPSSCLEPLVKAGADVNAESADGETPLLLAALSGSSKFVEYLIKEGAKVSCREKIFGFTPLHMAALQPDVTMIEYFLEQGLDVNDGGIYGITALHLASFWGNVKIMKLLIDRGADVHCRDNVTRSTALHFGAKDAPVLEHISLICGVESKPSWHPLMLPLKRSEYAVALLVQNGAVVNARDVHGRTPLHLAAMGAKLERFDDDHPQLQLAVHHQSLSKYFVNTVNTVNTANVVKIIEGLLMFGAHVDVQDEEGNLPLHDALKIGNATVIRTLLLFDLDVNEPDTRGMILSCEEKTKAWIFDQLLPLRAAQLPVSDDYGSSTMSVESQVLYARCSHEVVNMKTSLVDETTSIYNLLHMGWRRRLNFVKRLPANLQEKFPVYARIIQASRREAEQRKSLLDPAKLGWYRITEVNLPDVCVDRILAHLKNRYLRVLAEGLSEDSL